MSNRFRKTYRTILMFANKMSRTMCMFAKNGKNYINFWPKSCHIITIIIFIVVIIYMLACIYTQTTCCIGIACITNVYCSKSTTKVPRHGLNTKGKHRTCFRLGFCPTPESNQY